MKHFLVVSFAEKSDSREEILRRAQSSFGGEDAVPLDLGLGTHAFCLGGEGSSTSANAAWCEFVGTPALDPESRTVLAAEDVCPELAEGRFARFAQLAPPFAVVHAEHGSGRALGMTDALGYQHLYSFHGDGFACLSSSATWIASVARCAPDVAALGTYSLVGHFIGADSSFEGVTKLPAGSTCVLERGQRTISTYIDEPVALPKFASTEEAVAEGSRIVRDLLEGYVEAYPSPTIELSGGLDSRLVLAGLPPDSRTGCSAITIGEADSPDIRIARVLARKFQLDHRVLDFSELHSIEADEARALVDEAGVRADFSSNPFARGVLDWVNSKGLPALRLNGQNGELARGFYYPGQSDHPSPTTELISSLARWRIFGNDVVREDVFTAEFRGDRARTALSSVQSAFAGLPGGWLEASDEFYLSQRMQRWCGSAFSVANMDRPILSPFSSAAYVTWARRLSPSQKRNSSVFCQVLDALDVSLGREPLDSGMTPRDLYQGGLTARFRRGRQFGAKALAKMRQRLTRGTQAPTGAALLCSKATHGQATLRDLTPRVFELDFIRPEAGEFAIGVGRTGWTTVGFLLNLESMLDACE